MSRSTAPVAAALLPKTSRAMLADALLRPVVASQFPAHAVTLVLTVRLLAGSIAARRDPLVDLTQRLNSFTAARAVLDFSQACSRAWPENAMVSRPCCHALTPDETVFAQMAEAARGGDRQGFTAVLDGLVRRERHERLYAITSHAVAELSAADPTI
ncbi:hypothetical protein [Aurantiacibacter odishensis]|uniref:hypothetical protein n=1 Tax=Aurantiacibacter odishensis TaxID=1155476 RepID=UPI0013C47714|nr:hypothetical protein [Aurantiacibacter odishensis]